MNLEHLRNVSRLALVAVASLTAACAGVSRAPSMAVAAPEITAEPAPLDRSLFARTPNGQLTEDDLQALLDRPLELELPARVGVIPVVPAGDWRGPSPSYDMAPAGMSVFAKSLPSDDIFTLVTEMMPIPSGAIGMEALRELAARYKLRYLVLYREHVATSRRANGWAVGYASLLGALFLPGSTLRAEGYVEASVLDVKTGLLLLTVRRRVKAQRHSNLWHRDDKIARLQQQLATEVGLNLAGDVRGALVQFRTALTVENTRTRTAAAPAKPTLEVAPPRASM